MRAQQSRWWVLFLCFSLGAIASCRDAKRPDGGSALIPIGSPAPDVEGQATDGHRVRLGELRGSLAVVYFYPQDETPGCTKEACAFRDAFNAFQEKHITIFGVSRDAADAHAAFARNHKLPFSLVSDESGTIAQSYGVPSFMKRSSRVTFLVGRDGKIAHVWPDVDPAVHAQEVLRVAATL